MEKKSKTNKTLLVLVVVLALILVGGFVYAAVTGTLFFAGTATLQGGGGPSDEVQLQFYSVTESVTSLEGTGSSGTARLEAVNGVPNQKIVVDANFTKMISEYREPENMHDSLQFQYSVINTGTKPVKITGLSHSESSSSPFYYLRTLYVYPQDVVVQPGEIVAVRPEMLNLPYYFVLSPSGVDDIEPSEPVTFTFEAQMVYEEYHP